jgi:hypothetical protein
MNTTSWPLHASWKAYWNSREVLPLHHMAAAVEGCGGKQGGDDLTMKDHDCNSSAAPAAAAAAAATEAAAAAAAAAEEGCGGKQVV